MENINWVFVNEKIRVLLNSNQSLLEKNIIQGIIHYLDVDEYEMALELLCLALMNVDNFPLGELETMYELAKQLNLDKESVFDDNFWMNFTTALDKRRKNETT